MSDFEAKKRDWFLTEIVYKEKLAFLQNEFSEEETENWKERMKDNDADYKIRQSWGRCFERLELLILRYSAGDDISSLQTPCQEMLEEFKRHYEMFPEAQMLYWEADAYQYFMWLLALAYLFNLPDYLPQIMTWFAHNTESDQDDKLICELCKQLGVAEFNRPADWLMFDKPYQYLFDALQAGATGDKAQAQTHLANYLKNWYKGMKGCYWYDRHKGKFATHFGYWSFEAGMVTVLCGLDDASYRDMLYYPKDLVDYAREHFPVNSQPSRYNQRCEAGQACPREGYWFTPAKANSRRYFKLGDIMPTLQSDFGATIWQWDSSQPD